MISMLYVNVTLLYGYNSYLKSVFNPEELEKALIVMYYMIIYLFEQQNVKNNLMYVRSGNEPLYS